MTSLYHLTLNTGHVARTPRAQVDQTVVDHLLPMIDNSEGGFPGLGIGFDIYWPWTPDRKRMNGAAVVNITPWPKYDEVLPYTTMFCCWDQGKAEMIWPEVEDIVSTYRDKIGAARLPDTPPDAPWLAVIVFPTIASLDPDRVAMLGDMERCLFWTLAEGSK